MRKSGSQAKEEKSLFWAVSDQTGIVHLYLISNDVTENDQIQNTTTLWKQYKTNIISFQILLQIMGIPYKSYHVEW